MTGPFENSYLFDLLAVNPGTCFLPKRTFLQQELQPIRRFVEPVPRIVGQGFLHGIDDVRERVQSNDIGGTVSRTLWSVDQGTRQGVDLIEAESEAFGMVKCRKYGKQRI